MRTSLYAIILLYAAPKCNAFRKINAEKIPRRARPAAKKRLAPRGGRKNSGQIGKTLLILQTE